MKKQYIFVEENKGIGKNSQKPFHMVTLHDPKVYKNHIVSVDMSIISAPFGLQQGQVVTTELELTTPFDRTQPLLTGLNLVK